MSCGLPPLAMRNRRLMRNALVSPGVGDEAELYFGDFEFLGDGRDQTWKRNRERPAAHAATGDGESVHLLLLQPPNPIRRHSTSAYWER